MQHRLRVLGCSAALVTVLACSRDAKADDQPSTQRSTSTTTIVGASTLAAGYVPMFVMASGSLGHAVANFKPICGSFGGRCPEHDAVALYLPVVGPLLYARPDSGDDLYRRDRGPSSTEQILLYSSTVLQIGGIVTLLAGVSADKRRADSKPVVAPMAVAGGNGVTIASTF